MKLEDVTYEGGSCPCPKCGFPLEFAGWEQSKTIPLIGDIFFLLFTPKSWISGFFYKCDNCKHTFKSKVKL